MKPTSGYWIECKGGGSLVIADVTQQKEQKDQQNSNLLSDFFGMGQIPRSNTSSEGLMPLSRLEKNESSKSTNDMEPIG